RYLVSATPHAYSLRLHDALPIYRAGEQVPDHRRGAGAGEPGTATCAGRAAGGWHGRTGGASVSEAEGRRAGCPDCGKQVAVNREIGRAQSELQSRENLVCRLLLE